MSTLDLPYFFEDTTGLVSGPTDFFDIYDRPPFLRLHHPHHTSQRPVLNARRGSTTELAIYELGARTFFKSNRHHSHRDTLPSVLLSFDDGLRGFIKFQGGGPAMQIERWLKKSATFGSPLTRDFKGLDGMSYRWKFRSPREHEWTCIQLGTNYVVAHYDLKSADQLAYRTSGNVLTVYPNWAHLSIELLASLVVMRHIYATISSD